MPIRMIPNLLKDGDKELGLPRKDLYYLLVGQIGTALPLEQQRYAYPHRPPKSTSKIRR